MTYVIITTEHVTFHSGVPSLEELQQIVGGYIEVVASDTIKVAASDTLERYRIGVTWYVNDEGRQQKLPLTAMRYGQVPIYGPIVGTFSRDTSEGRIDVDGPLTVLPVSRMQILLQRFYANFPVSHILGGVEVLG